MAAKRIASSSINWSAIAERVPKDQRAMFNSLKTKSDSYLRRVLANPETPPKIDFASYKSKIPIPGLVDSLQKQYEALKIPYPADKLTSEINAQEKKGDELIKQFIAASMASIKECERGIAKWDDVLPYEEMTMEDVKDQLPEMALDPLNNPTFWPHTPEEQLGYKEPEAEALQGDAKAH